MITFAIGDIHGMLHLLHDALAWIRQQMAESEEAYRVVFLGDYIDRGPDSRGVLQLLCDGSPSPREEWVMLLGNHEVLMFNSLFMGDDTHLRVWMNNGGDATLKQYILPGTVADIDGEALRDHMLLIQGLQPTFDDGAHFFAHASINPALPLDAQPEETVLWGRDKTEPAYRDLVGRQFVHGHTPQRGAPLVTNHEVNLDTGACYTGRLTVGMFLEGADLPTIRQFS